MNDGIGRAFDPAGEARDVLQSAVSDFGARVLSNAAVLEGICEDRLPELPREASLIASAARADVAGMLAQQVGGVGPDAAVRLTAATLADSRSLDPSACVWVVSEFARCLGHPVSEGLAPANTGQQAPAVPPPAPVPPQLAPAPAFPGQPPVSPPPFPGSAPVSPPPFPGSAPVSPSPFPGAVPVPPAPPTPQVPPATAPAYSPGPFNQTFPPGPGQSYPGGQVPGGAPQQWANAGSPAAYPQPGAYPQPTPPASAYANWGQRAGAYLVDVAPAAVLVVIGSVITGATRNSAPILLAVLAGIVWSVYNRWIQAGRTGQSLGKKVAGVKLVSEATGAPIGAGMAFVRDLAHAIDGAICYVGFLFPLWDAKRQTIADKITGTIVVPVRS